MLCGHTAAGVTRIAAKRMQLDSISFPTGLPHQSSVTVSKQEQVKKH